jgi:hypothetical protein
MDMQFQVRTQEIEFDWDPTNAYGLQDIVLLKPSSNGGGLVVYQHSQAGLAVSTRSVELNGITGFDTDTLTVWPGAFGLLDPARDNNVFPVRFPESEVASIQITWDPSTGGFQHTAYPPFDEITHTYTSSGVYNVRYELTMNEIPGIYYQGPIVVKHTFNAIV